MSISTADKPEDRREKLKKLKEYHQPTFDANGIVNPTFIPKMAYKPFGKTEVHIGFFMNEISKGDDVYVEFTSKELVPEDPERRLYKWRFNPNFQEEYEQTEPNPQSGHTRYLVPINELIVIPRPTQQQSIQQVLNLDEIPNPDDDLPYNQMTIRDYAAIHLGKPVSRKKWLNDLIIK